MNPTFETTHSRRTDPQTSHMAAASASKFAGSHVVRILAALQAYGMSTPPMIGTYTGLTVVQIDRRLPDLQRAGLAEVVQEGGIAKVRGGYRVWRAIDQSFAAMGDAARSEMVERGYGG